MSRRSNFGLLKVFIGTDYSVKRAGSKYLEKKKREKKTPHIQKKKN